MACQILSRPQTTNHRLYILETEGNREDHMNVGTPDLNTHNRSNLSAHVNNAP